MSSDSWVQYAEYARRLDAVRAEELARTAGMREGVAQMTTHADELEARLRGQGGMLTELAGKLRLRRPRLTEIPVQEMPDPAVALGQVATSIDRGDADARQAAERGYHPALMPGLRGRGRNVLVYGVAALLVLGLQALAFSRSGTETNPIMVLFVLPLMGFALAYLVLRIGSRTRMVVAAPDLSTRLGFLLCFLIGPIAAAAAVALTYKSK